MDILFLLDVSNTQKEEFNINLESASNFIKNEIYSFFLYFFYTFFIYFFVDCNFLAAYDVREAFIAFAGPDDDLTDFPKIRPANIFIPYTFSDSVNFTQNELSVPC